MATLWKGGGLPQHVAYIAFGGATIISIDATKAERRLIVIDQNRAVAWVDMEKWTILDRWPGED